MSRKALLSLPVTSIVTSNQCGHCVKMRLDGRLLPDSKAKSMSPSIPGGYRYNYTFIHKLLTGNKEGNVQLARVINIHTALLDGKTVTEYIEFSLEADLSITQMIYRQQEGGNNLLEIETLRITATERTEPLSDVVKKITATWSGFLQEHVPAKLIAYFYSYPSIMVFSAENWDIGLKGEEFYGVVLNAETNTESPFGINYKSVRDDPSDVIPLYVPYITGQKTLITPRRMAAPLSAAKETVAVANVAPVSALAPTVITPKSQPLDFSSSDNHSEQGTNKKVWIPTGVCKAGYKIKPLHP